MPRQTGRLRTEHASKYMQQLLRHFAHKVTVNYDTVNGTADMPWGPIRMTASAEELRAEITGADDETLARARDVIDRHLVPFAHREAVTGLVWEDPVADPA